MFSIHENHECLVFMIAAWKVILLCVVEVCKQNEKTNKGGGIKKSLFPFDSCGSMFYSEDYP